MREKLDLKQLLVEIQEDDASEATIKSRLVSHDEIQAMLEKRGRRPKKALDETKS